MKADREAKEKAEQDAKEKAERSQRIAKARHRQTAAFEPLFHRVVFVRRRRDEREALRRGWRFAPRAGDGHRRRDDGVVT